MLRFCRGIRGNVESVMQCTGFMCYKSENVLSWRTWNEALNGCGRILKMS